MSDIQNIPTINLKGKQYSEVKDRVMFFRLNEQFKGWRIVTKPLNISNDEATFFAEVYNDMDKVVSTGTAYERASQGMVNKTSHVENCETSAVGRALGFLGIGIVGGIAPADDVIKVVNKEDIKISDEQRQTLAAMIQDSQTDLIKFNETFSIQKLTDLPQSEFNRAFAMLQSKINKMKKDASPKS